ncbi:MAG: hypothetical protein WCY30_01640, partial [Candidatus Neomarinimicrobiota bacterium]
LRGYTTITIFDFMVTSNINNFIANVSTQAPRIIQASKSIPVTFFILVLIDFTDALSEPNTATATK